MKNNRDFQIEKTGYNYRPGKYRDILAVVLDANNKVIDAIAPETDNHRTTLDWAEWRAESIRNDYPAAIRMEVYCGNEEIAVISFLETPNPDNTPTTMTANGSVTRKKSINCIMNQANRLMSVCNGARNFKRANVIRAIAFRYYDNIRARVGRVNYDDNSEYDKEYPRAQYMTANGSVTRKKSINCIMNQANRLMDVCNGARNFKRANAIRAIAFRYYANIRTCAERANYDENSEYNKKYPRVQYMNANESAARKKSINSIMDQANSLMSVCNGVRNFKRTDAIREIASRYFDNIRTCAERANYDDNSEYEKEYPRVQYMNANESAARKKSINCIMNQANRLMSVCNGARNFKRADVIREIAFRYYDNIRYYANLRYYAYIRYYDNLHYYDTIRYFDNLRYCDKEYSRAQYMNANESVSRKKSINCITNQANSLMDVCNGARNFKRTKAIRAISSRYFDNIRACVGRFNYDDDSEYDKEYPRVQYMNANKSATRKKSINCIMNQANRLMSVCNGARNFKRADVIRAIAFRYYDNIRACVGRFNYDDDSEYEKEYPRVQYMNA